VTSAAASLDVVVSRRRRRAQGLARLLRRPTAAISFGVVSLLVLGSVGAPLVAPYPKNKFDLNHLSARRRSRTRSAPTSSVATC